MKRLILVSLLFTTVLSADSVTLSWHDNSWNEEGWIIERSERGSAFVEVAKIKTTTGLLFTKEDKIVKAEWTDTSLSSVSTYYQYRVKAYNGVGESGYTNVVTKTIDGPPEDPTSLTGEYLKDE